MITKPNEIFAIYPQALPDLPYLLQSVKESDLQNRAQVGAHKVGAFMIDSDVNVSVDYEDYMITVKHGNKTFALVMIDWVMVKYGFGYGQLAWARDIRVAAQSKKYDGIMLYIDSPGGTVDGTPELARAVAECSKPIVAYVDGVCASAAYWAASNANAIYLNADNFNTLGSIGALFTAVNYSEYLEKQGIKMRVVRAEQSDLKALMNPFEEVNEDEYNRQKAIMTQMVDVFIKHVKAGRGKKLKDDGEVFRGQTYMNEDALKIGLADYAGTMKMALNYLHQIS